MGEPAGEGRVWVAILIDGLGGDGEMRTLATDDGRSIDVQVRVLPRGAGHGDLRRTRAKKIDPANVVAAVVGVALLIYILVFR